MSPEEIIIFPTLVKDTSIILVWKLQHHIGLLPLYNTGQSSPILLVLFCGPFRSSFPSFRWFCACCSVPQSCPTLSDPTNCSPPGSSVHGIIPLTTLNWFSISSSRGSSRSRERSCVSYISCLGRRILYHCTHGYHEFEVEYMPPRWHSPQLLSFSPFCTLSSVLSSCYRAQIYPSPAQNSAIKGRDTKIYCHPAYLTYMQNTS